MTIADNLINSSRPAGAAEVEVDVRDDLRSGREPFSRIMAAVNDLPSGAVLHLRAIFEPAPLYKVLGKRGFEHESRAWAPDDWSVWFWRQERRGPFQADQGADADLADTAMPRRTDEHWLDVRGLEPPEPMRRTLEALETLPAGHTLVQLNVRVPQFLLPMLIERGFTFTIDEQAPDRVVVRIRRDTSTPQELAAMAVQPIELDVRVIAPREKHPTIFRTFDALAPGQAMVIVNDHDPRPLRYQLAAERPDTFDWTYEAEGPEIWRVRIARR